MLNVAKCNQLAAVIGHEIAHVLIQRNERYHKHSYRLLD